jgi:hypothetical protein
LRNAADYDIFVLPVVRETEDILETADAFLKDSCAAYTGCEDTDEAAEAAFA